MPYLAAAVQNRKKLSIYIGLTLAGAFWYPASATGQTPDVKNYGASGSGLSASGTMSAGSSNLIYSPAAFLGRRVRAKVR